MNYDPGLVLRVNELYHDLEEREYERSHQDLFRLEGPRWQKIAQDYLAPCSGPLMILDLGTGTGLVPLQIAGFLKASDQIVCADLSEKMLAVCRENIGRNNFPCRFQFLKLDGKRIDLESGLFEVITLNSVLHHIPEFQPFFQEINRLLKPGGRLIIGHEPNRFFFADKFLFNLCQFLSIIFRPRQFAGAVLRRLRLFEPARKIYRRFNPGMKSHSEIIARVNQRLGQEGLIQTPLSSSQISALVDIHSPTAGGYHRDRGIEFPEILSRHLSNFQVVSFETYGHLGEISGQNRLTKHLDSFLKKRFPQSGSILFAVLKKNG